MWRVKQEPLNKFLTWLEVSNIQKMRKSWKIFSQLFSNFLLKFKLHASTLNPIYVKSDVLVMREFSNLATFHQKVLILAWKNWNLLDGIVWLFWLFVETNQDSGELIQDSTLLKVLSVLFFLAFGSLEGLFELNLPGMPFFSFIYLILFISILKSVELQFSNFFTLFSINYE